MSRPHDAVERRADELARVGRPVQAHGEPPTSRFTSGGKVLPDDFRATAEAHLGADFSRVRLHNDSESAEVSEWIGARAFTIGADVFLGRGGVDLSRDREMIMHELAHTVQQGERGGLAVHRRLIVDGEPWFELQKVRDQFGERGVEIYLKMRDDQGFFEYPNEGALFEEIELRLLAVKMFAKVEVQGTADDIASAERGPNDGCCRYPRNDEHFNLSETNWTAESTSPPIFKIKNGVRPSAAIRSIFAPRAGTVLDCGMTIVALRYRALAEKMGNDKFDARFQGENAPVISKLHKSSLKNDIHPLLQSGHILDELVPYDPQDPTRHIIPGDHVYFRNHSSYQGRLWHGEQAIYIGNGRFVGFGLTETEQLDGTKIQKYAVTHDEMIEGLRAELNDPNISVDQIPGLQSESDPGFINVRRPSMPGNDYYETL